MNERAPNSQPEKSMENAPEFASDFSPEIPPELAAFESQLRELQPRPATAPWVAVQTNESHRNATWKFATTWVSGVAVGCLIMANWSATEGIPTGPSAAVTLQKTQPADPSNVDVAANAVSTADSLLLANGNSRWTQRVNSVLKSGVSEERLLAGSHLGLQLPTQRNKFNREQAVRPVEPSPSALPSKPKSRNQLILELLQSERL